MGLISRVSSRTYRSTTKKPPTMLRISLTKTMVARRPLTTTSIKNTDLVQSLYVSKIQEYAKMSAAGQLDYSSVNAGIEAAKERAGGLGDMESFPVLNFTDADHGAASKFSLSTGSDVSAVDGSGQVQLNYQRHQLWILLLEFQRATLKIFRDFLFFIKF